MSLWKKLLTAFVIVPLIVFIGLAGLSLLTAQNVEAKRRELVAAGAKTETEKVVPGWLKAVQGEEFHTFLDETVLTEVKMTGPEITDETLEKLAGIKGLRLLDLSQSSITDAGLKHLSGLTSLQSLKMFKTQVKDLTPLAPLTNLRSLIIEHTQVHDDNLVVVEKFPRLHELNASYLELTDAGIEHIAKCQHLLTLGLSGTDLTDRGCELISQLTDLTMLVIANANPSADGMQAFQKAVPDCTVVRQL